MGDSFDFLYPRTICLDCRRLSLERTARYRASEKVLGVSA
jgi:hypothetical protein